MVPNLNDHKQGLYNDYRENTNILQPQETLGCRPILSFLSSDSDFIRDELQNLKTNKQETLLDLLFRNLKDGEKKKQNIEKFFNISTGCEGFNLDLNMSNPIK